MGVSWMHRADFKPLNLILITYALLSLLLLFICSLLLLITTHTNIIKLSMADINYYFLISSSLSFAMYIAHIRSARAYFSQLNYCSVFSRCLKSHSPLPIEGLFVAFMMMFGSLGEREVK